MCCVCVASCVLFGVCCLLLVPNRLVLGVRSVVFFCLVFGVCCVGLCVSFGVWRFVFVDCSSAFGVCWLLVVGRCGSLRVVCCASCDGSRNLFFV